VPPGRLLSAVAAKIGFGVESHRCSRKWVFTMNSFNGQNGESLSQTRVNQPLLVLSVMVPCDTN